MYSTTRKMTLGVLALMALFANGSANAEVYETLYFDYWPHPTYTPEFVSNRDCDWEYITSYPAFPGVLYTYISNGSCAYSSQEVLYKPYYHPPYTGTGAGVATIMHNY